MIIQTSAYSQSSPERLWSLVSDLERWPEMLPTVDRIEALEAGRPAGVGARYRLSQPRLPDAVYEITDWQEGRAFTWVATAPGVTTTACHEVTAIKAGSRLHLALDWNGPLALPVKVVLAGKARSMVTDEADTFARLAEGREGRRER